MASRAFPVPSSTPAAAAGTADQDSDIKHLHLLAAKAGVQASPALLDTLIELLRLGVTPQGIIALLRSVRDARARAALSAQA
eukprot:1713217-Pleurochrysis_carterae.AAC.2